MEHERRQRESQFTEWAAEHAAILFRVAHAFAGPKERDDLHQELLLALWKALPAFRGECQPATFVYRITHNAALTWKRARRHDSKLEPLDTAGPGLPARDNVAGEAEERERLERLYAAIRRLPTLDRSLVLLSLDGLSYEEIAALHGLSVTNVGARLTRARQKLISDLEGR